MHARGSCAAGLAVHEAHGRRHATISDRMRWGSLTRGDSGVLRGGPLSQFKGRLGGLVTFAALAFRPPRRWPLSQL
eukprot:4407883-Prymnesium_polylepis.1